MERRANILAAAGAGCGLLGVASWIFYFNALRGIRFEDWMVFHVAARAALAHHMAILYHGRELTALLNATFADWLAKALPLHPWLYPPHFLLLLVPFGALPPALGLAAFLGLSFAALVLALCAYAKDTGERWLYAVSMLLSPGAALVCFFGQNTFLSCAILIGGFALLPKRPVVAGLLFGILSYKPQLAVLVPVALVATRQWKTILAAAASALVLIAVSAASFGIQPWHDWISALATASEANAQWSSLARANGMNVFADAAFLGAPLPVANILQVGGTVLGGIFVWWFERSDRPHDLKLAVLLALTMLAAPHFLIYDALAVEIAATIFFAAALRYGGDRLDIVVALGLWLCPLINPPTAYAAGIITPALAGFLLWRAVRWGVRGSGRGADSAPLPLPA